MKSGFFNSNITGYDDEGMPIFDRAQEASFFAKYFSNFIGNGIYPNPSTSMQILKNEGMSVIVSIGCCFINGYFGWVEENEVLPIENADTLARIDRVVARLNFVDRNIDLVVKKGTPSANPIPVDVERTSDYYEIVLADVKVNANVSKITQANITDMRLDTSLCGIVSGVVDQVDTTTLANQYLSWYEELTKQAEIDMQTRERSFDEWFEEMKGKLSGDVAGKLQLQIDDLTVELAETKQDLEDAVSPIITEDGDYIITEDNQKLVVGM